MSISVFLGASGLGCEAISCSFAASRSVRASTMGPNTFLRRAALLRLETLARTLFAIVNKIACVFQQGNSYVKSALKRSAVVFWEGNCDEVVGSKLFFYRDRRASYVIRNKAPSGNGQPPPKQTNITAPATFLEADVLLQFQACVAVQRCICIHPLDIWRSCIALCLCDAHIWGSLRLPHDHSHDFAFLPPQWHPPASCRKFHTSWLSLRL